MVTDIINIMTDVEQCNGNTLKGERCRRKVFPINGINTNIVNGLVYCSVHLTVNKNKNIINHDLVENKIQNPK